MEPHHMHDETIILGHLVKSLDDASSFCTAATLNATRPWLQHMLEQLATTHQSIADELRSRISAIGGECVGRDGKRRQTWRARWLNWLARNHFDSDLAYVQLLEKQQDRLAKRFARAVRRTSHGDTHWRLQRQLYEIDHARMKTMRVVALVQEEDDARWLEGRGRMPAPASAAPPQSAAKRGRFEA